MTEQSISYSIRDVFENIEPGFLKDENLFIVDRLTNCLIKHCRSFLDEKNKLYKLNGWTHLIDDASLLSKPEKLNDITQINLIWAVEDLKKGSAKIGICDYKFNIEDLQYNDIGKNESKCSIFFVCVCVCVCV